MSIPLCFLCLLLVCAVVRSDVQPDPQDEENPNVIRLLFVEAQNDEDSLVNPWEKSGKFQGDIKVADSFAPRNLVRHRTWPSGVVPYTIDQSAFSIADLRVIKYAMKKIENVLSSLEIADGSCQIMFVHRQPYHRDYIRIGSNDSDDACWSEVGVVGGAQDINLGKECLETSTVLHELMHALGFEHQHSAHNRDDYVRVNWENVEPGEEENFEKASEADYTDFGFGYDYKSIMHYSPYASARLGPDERPFGPTLTSLNPKIKLSRNKKLSEVDKLKLQHMYCGQHTHIP